MAFKIPKRIRLMLKSIFLLMLVCTIGFCVWFLWMTNQVGSDVAGCYLAIDPELVIQKTTPDGVKYTVNNSQAMFDLDVVKSDKHSEKLFSDYASALKYCASADLPVIPSVQLIHGKAKHFNDQLCAVLELAIQDGVAESPITGKRIEIKRLLSMLVAEWEGLPKNKSHHVESAIVYVATALQVGGGNPALPPELAPRVQSEAESFLSKPLQSRPLGFWQESEALRGLFAQDRFLMQGLLLKDDPAACLVLSMVISRDTQLSREFKRYREFASKMTNPPKYIRQGEMLSPSAQCPSFADLAALLPSDTTLEELLETTQIEEFRVDSMKQFGSAAGFALVSYSRSKEYALILKYAPLGELHGRESMLDIVINAIEQGSLTLQPEPESGWYDYQWYALETLLLPKLARESSKLILTDAYKKRLKTAFKSMITKDRETHIKHLPLIMIGSISSEETPVKVEIGPEFSAEPTATVYLRTARAYRFLRNALTAVLGKESLEALTISSQTDASLDADLLEMSLLMYGIYDRVSTELGLTPSYLPDEMGTNDITRAKAIATSWFANIATDPNLAHDTRVSVPVFAYPGGSLRYWATGGVRLEKVRYEYVSDPYVVGVNPTFVPAFCYLPTDISLEFERASGIPLTRTEFRQMCDSCETEATLRKLLGAKPETGGKVRYVVTVLAVLFLVVFLGILFRKLPRPIILKSMRVILVVLALMLAIWILVLVCSPYHRVKFLVRNVAAKNIGLGLMVQMKYFASWNYNKETPEQEVRALMDLLSDDDSQVRYLAMSYLYTILPKYSKKAKKQTVLADFEDPLRAAADDPIPEVASGALFLLGEYKNDENISFLREKLKIHSSNEQICMAILFALGEIGDKRVLDDVMPFTEDSRYMVRRLAISRLGRYDDARSAGKIVELLESTDYVSSKAAVFAVTVRRQNNKNETEFSKGLDPVLSKIALNNSLAPRHRLNMANAVIDIPSRVLALENILLHPSASQHNTIDACRIAASSELGALGPAAAAAIPSLQKLRSNPEMANDVRLEINRALKKIKKNKDSSLK